jgi:hypothetical protein
MSDHLNSWHRLAGRTLRHAMQSAAHTLRIAQTRKRKAQAKNSGRKAQESFTHLWSVVVGK